MDEFEIFKARASGCEIRVEDLDSSEAFQRRSARNSLRSEGCSEDARRTNRRKSLKKNARQTPREDKEGSLRVKVEIQPPSPVSCRKLSDLQSPSSIEENFRSNGPAVQDGGTVLSSELVRKHSFDLQVHENISGALRGNEARRSRHSFTGSCHGDDPPASDEFARNPLDMDDEEKFQRSKSCRVVSRRRSRQVIHAERRPSQVSNSSACRDVDDHDDDDDEEGSVTPPTVYRVRSFTTKKGEIISRGDSFKVCGSGNRQFLLVGDQRSPGQRRCSAAVPGGSYSRLEVCTLTPGSNSMRRSSLTCLAANQLTPVARRGSSECRRKSSSKIDVALDAQRKTSLASTLESLPRVTQEGQQERWSNKSNEAEDASFCMTEQIELHPPPQVYHVTVLGHPGVGKTTLINQLMTSEYLANKEQNDQGEEEGDTVVSVVLDGIESAVHFQEGPCTVEEASVDHQTDAYLLVFSVTERASLSFIQSCLHDILKNDKRLHHTGAPRKVPLKLRFHRQKASTDAPTTTSEIDNSHNKQQQDDTGEELRPPKPVLYLLANKQDLVRNRVVSETDVKRLTDAKKNKCKYAEASALLDHKVDEVLVDLVREIRARAASSEQEDSDIEDVSGRGCLQQAMVGFCGKLFK